MLAIITFTLVSLAVVVAILLANRSQSTSRGRWARLLSWTALIAALVTAGALAKTTWQDAGGVAAVLLGVPVLLAAVAALANQAGSARRAITWLAALLLLGWALVLGLGIGLFFLPAAVLLLGAAVTTANPTSTHPAAPRMSANG